MNHVLIRKVLCKSAASRSGLPGLDWALNPYRGCAHACSYCYAQDVTRFEMARPWGEVIEVKTNFVPVLRQQLVRKPEGVFGLGTVTDPYQGLEKEYELARGSLAELRRTGSSVSVLTKSDLVLRDLDLLVGWNGAEVGISIGIHDEEMSSVLEPGAPRPERRLRALRELAESGVETYAMVAPVIPGVCDSERSISGLVSAVADAGVKRIMWDRFNTKPIAGARLKSTLAARSIALGKGGADWESFVRGVFRRECHNLGVELVDAF